MKLVLMRHGHIHRYHADDLSIKLTPKGINEVKEVAYLLNKSLTIEKIIVSPALRTRQTAEIVANINDTGNTKIVDDLYHVSNHDFLLRIIKDEIYDTKNLLVIGHNPYINALPSLLIREDQDDYLLLNTEDRTARAVVMTYQNKIDYKKFIVNHILLPNS